jgi:hypothetical protein
MMRRPGLLRILRRSPSARPPSRDSRATGHDQIRANRPDTALITPPHVYVYGCANKAFSCLKI